MWVALGSQARRELTPASIARGAVVCHEPPPVEWIRVGGRCAAGVRLCRRGGRAEHGGMEPHRRRGRARAVGADRAPGVVGNADRSAAGARGGCARADRRGTGAAGRWRPFRRPGSTPTRCSRPTAGAATGSTSGGPRSLRSSSSLGGARRPRAWSKARRRSGCWRRRPGGVLSDGDARTLADAFELALELRIGHHMARIAAGRPPDDQIEPAEISPLMRDHLRDVFRAVTTVQRRLRG